MALLDLVASGEGVGLAQEQQQQRRRRLGLFGRGSAAAAAAARKREAAFGEAFAELAAARRAQVCNVKLAGPAVASGKGSSGGAAWGSSAASTSCTPPRQPAAALPQSCSSAAMGRQDLRGRTLDTLRQFLCVRLLCSSRRGCASPVNGPLLLDGFLLLDGHVSIFCFPGGGPAGGL